MDNEFNLLIELPNGKTLTKKFKMYDTKPGSEEVIKLNKKLKEFNAIEEIQRKFKGKKVLWS